MADESKTAILITELLTRLQNVKLGPGVVGRNSSIVWAFMLVMLAGAIVSGIEHSTILLSLSLAGAILVALVALILNVYFGNKNPAAALLEGAHFVEYHQIEMAAKGMPRIEPSSPPSLPPMPPDHPSRKNLDDPEPQK
jgi:hypothetical protein